jgi:hypothetical protein
MFKKLLSKLKSKLETTVSDTPVETSPSQPQVSKTTIPEPVQDGFNLEALANWIKEKETLFLAAHNYEQDLNEYVLQIRKLAWRLNHRANHWVDNLDLSKLKIISVGEINSLFSDIQTLGKLLITKKEITLKNVSIFNHLLRDKVLQIQQRIEDSAIKEELVTLSQQDINLENPTENTSSNLPTPESNVIYHDYTETPLWKELQQIDTLRQQFEIKVKNQEWEKIHKLRESYLLISKYKRSLEELNLRLKTNKEHLSSVVYSLSEKNKELSVLKTKPEFSSVEEREVDLQNLTPEMEALKTQLALFFSPLKPIFQLYHKLYPDNPILPDYIQNYLAAFQEDEDLTIMSIIRKIRIAVDEHQMKVSDSDRAILIERAEKTNSGELREMHKQYCKLKQKLEEMSHSGDRAMIMKLDDLYYRLEHFRSEEKRLRFVIKQILEEIETNKQSLFAESNELIIFAKENFNDDLKIRLKI